MRSNNRLKALFVLKNFFISALLTINILDSDSAVKHIFPEDIL